MGGYVRLEGQTRSTRNNEDGNKETRNKNEYLTSEYVTCWRHTFVEVLTRKKCRLGQQGINKPNFWKKSHG